MRRREEMRRHEEEMRCEEMRRCEVMRRHEEAMRRRPEEICILDHRVIHHNEEPHVTHSSSYEFLPPDLSSEDDMSECETETVRPRPLFRALRRHQESPFVLHHEAPHATRSSSFEFLPPDMTADLRAGERTRSYEFLPANKPHVTHSSSYEFLPPDLSSEDDMSECETETVRPRPLFRALRRHQESHFVLHHEAPHATRSSSFEFLPPDMSELRVVLLGSSWSQRSSVGNFILGETKFNTEEDAGWFLTERGHVKEKEIVLINTPDLLLLPHRVRRVLESVCDPGPHVFLLVLQPEDFTEQHKLRLCSFLRLFSDRPFDHCLVLISTPREESPGLMEKYQQHPPLKDMIRQCRYRFLWQKNVDLPELLTRLGQVVKESKGEHLSSSYGFLPPDLSPEDQMIHEMLMHDHMFDCDMSEYETETVRSLPFIGVLRRHQGSHLVLHHEEPHVTRSSSFEFLPPDMSELRVVLLGSSWSQRSSVGNFILGETKFNTEEDAGWFLTERGHVKEKEIVLINTPDLLLLPHRVRRVLESVCDPGPHVFLLVLQPEDFTEQHKLRLCSFLRLFSDRPFDHCLVLISTPREESPGLMEKYQQHPPLKDMIRQCRYRFLWQKNVDLPELLTRLGQVVKESKGEHLRLDTSLQIW
ncbi:uncharacterized protein LOC121606501 isoform X2 [Chelmon rostratus]|uniref:uncharacterized protein LOC121606501 isoform X2 n=1 Tax=Chelmon rostratus TaxID=109905 RepID=UPI001BEB53AB|nr:uncharacterized protein LOC121606501 isoform X2 [Chelmon rostratus]